MESKTAIPPKPPSDIFKGYGLSATPLLTDTITLQGIRDNFTLSTWLLVGASLQCTLFLPFLNIRPSYAILPAISLLSFRLVRWMLMCVGIVSHPYADGMLPGKKVAVLPPAVDVGGLKKDEDEGGICVIMLFARCHSPLGILAPHYATLSAQMRLLIHNLDASSPSNGFLGGSSFTNTCTRTTSSEVMTLAYFSSHASLQAFAHGPEHRKVWDWWNELGRKKGARHISIAHEVFKARKGEWEGIYVNQAPSFFAATQHLVKNGDEYQWISPLADAKGRYRSALGRIGKTNGDDNEKYGDDPWDNV